MQLTSEEKLELLQIAFLLTDKKINWDKITIQLALEKITELAKKITK